MEVQSTKAVILAFIRDYRSPSRIWLENLLPQPRHSEPAYRQAGSAKNLIPTGPSLPRRARPGAQGDRTEGLGNRPFRGARLQDGHGCWWHLCLLSKTLGPGFALRPWEVAAKKLSLRD